MGFAAVNVKPEATPRQGGNAALRRTTEAREADLETQAAAATALARRGDAGAAKALQDVLADPYMQRVAPGNRGFGDAVVQAKYTALKALGAVLSDAGDLQGALRAYGESLRIDNTDCVLWVRLGRVAEQAGNFALARHALENAWRQSAAGKMLAFEPLKRILGQIGDEAALERIVRAAGRHGLLSAAGPPPSLATLAVAPAASPASRKRRSSWGHALQPPAPKRHRLSDVQPRPAPSAPRVFALGSYREPAAPETRRRRVIALGADPTWDAFVQATAKALSEPEPAVPATGGSVVYSVSVRVADKEVLRVGPADEEEDAAPAPSEPASGPSGGGAGAAVGAVSNGPDSRGRAAGSGGGDAVTGGSGDDGDSGDGDQTNDGGDAGSNGEGGGDAATPEEAQGGGRGRGRRGRGRKRAKVAAAPARVSQRNRARDQAEQGGESEGGSGGEDERGVRLPAAAWASMIAKLGKLCGVAAGAAAADVVLSQGAATPPPGTEGRRRLVRMSPGSWAVLADAVDGAWSLAGFAWGVLAVCLLDTPAGWTPTTETRRALVGIAEAVASSVALPVEAHVALAELYVDLSRAGTTRGGSNAGSGSGAEHRAAAARHAASATAALARGRDAMAAFCGSVAGRWRPAWCTATDSEAAHAAVAGLRVAFVRALLAYDAGKLEDAQRVLTACLGYVEKGAVSLDGAWARAPGPTHSDVVPRASKEAMSRVLQSIKLRLLVGTQQEETVASPTPVRRGLAQLRSLIDTTSGRPPLAEMDADSELFGRTVADLKQAVASADDLSESDKCRLSVMAATVPLCASLADEDKMVQAAVVWARPDAPAPAWARWAREAARDLQPFAASLFSAAHGALSDQDRAVLAQARSGLLRAVATVPATPQMEDTAWQVEAASNALSCVLLLSLADKSVARNASKVIKMALGVVLAAHVSPFPPALTGVHRLALDVGATVMSVYEQCVSDMQSAEPSPALTPDHGKPLTQEDDGDSDSDGPLDSSALCTSLRRLRRPELHALRPWLTALVSSAVNTVSEADMREPPEVAGLPSEVLPPVTPLWSLGGPAERGGRHTLNNNVVIGTQHQDARLYNAAEVIATTLPRTHGRLMWSAVTAHLDAADPSVDKVTALEGAGSPFRIAVLAMLGTSAMGLKEALQRCAELELRITALLQHDGGADAVASAVRTWPAASLATSVGTSVLAPGVQAPAAVRPEAAQGAPSALPDGVEELLRWHAGAGEAAGDGGKEGSGGTILPGTVDVSDMEALAEACALQGAVLAARAKSKRERERAAAPDRVLAPALGNLMPAAVMSNSPGGQEEAPDATQAPATLSTPLRWMVMAIACAPWTAHGWAGMQAILGDLAQHMWADGVAVLARDPTSIRNALGHKSYLAEFDDLPRQLHAASRLLNWAVLCGRIANEVAARWRSPGSDAALRKELGALHRRQQMILFCATRTGAPFMGAKGYPRFPVQIPYVQPGTRAKMLYEALASFAAAQQHLPPPAGSTEAWLLPFLAGVCALDLWNSKARGSPDPLPLLSQSVLASCERRRNKGDHDEKGDEGDTATENADDAAAASPPLLVPFHALHAARLDVLLMLKDSPSGAWHASADIAGMLHSVAQAGFVPGAITAKDRDAMWGEALKDIQAAMVGILASQARFSPARATLARCIAARGSEEDISEAAEQLAVDGGHVLHTFTLRGRGARSGGPTRVLVTPHEWLTRTFRGAQIPAEDGGPSPGPTAGSAGLRPERLEGGFPAPGASGVGLWWATSAGQDTVALLVQLLVAADRAEELVDIVAFWHGTETLQQGMGLRVELPVYGARTDRPPRLYDDLMFGALGLAAWLVRVRCKQEQDTTVESQDTTIEVSASERLVKFYLAWAHKWEAMSGTVAHAMITALGEGTPRSGSEVIEAAMREAIKPNWADAGRWWPITCVANLAHRAGLASPPGPDAPQRDKIQALEESGGAAFLKLALTYLDRTLPELKDPLGRLVSLLPEMRGLVPPPPGQAPGASSAPRQGEVLYPDAGQLLVRFHDIVLAGVRAALGEMDIDFLGVPVTLLPDAPFPAPEDEAWKIWEDCVDSRKTKTSATQLDQALRPLLQKLDSLRGRLDLDFVARAVEQRDGKPSELQPVVARLVVALAVSGAIVGTMKIRSEANELRQELAAERKAAEDDGKPAAAVEARTKPLIERIEEADAVWHRLHGMIGQCRTLYNDLKQQGDVAAAPGTCRLEANPLCSLGARSDAAVVLAPFKSSLRDRLRRLVDALTKPRCWGARDSLRVGIKARAPARRTDAGAAAQEAPDAEPAAVGRAGARGAARSPADTDSRTEAANIVIEVLDIVCKASRGALMMVNETVIAAGPVPTR